MTRWQDYESKTDNIRPGEELIINSGWIVKRVDVNKFKWVPWERWPAWERWEPFRFSDFTEEQLKNLKWVWIKKIIQQKVWKITTVTVELTDSSSFNFEISDWADWAGVGDLLSSNNLSDLVDKVEARKNLKVYSKDEVDSKKTDSDNKIDLINTALLNKVDKIVWYWLSKNDFTDAALAKLNSINPDLFSKLDSENIFTKNQTIKTNWANLYLDSTSYSSLRYKKDSVELFALSVWDEKNFKISRFVNGNWVWDVLTINNNDWKIWFGVVNNSGNLVQINWSWLGIVDNNSKMEIVWNRILPWFNWYNAELWWWAFTWDSETFWIWTHKKMALTASSIKLQNIKKEPDIYWLSSWDIYLKKFRDDYYLALIP